MGDQQIRHPLRRGTILRRARPTDAVEVAIVLGPSPRRPDEAAEAIHGWTDNPPDVGHFTLFHEHVERGLWKIATEEDAAAVRALFLAHAREWGPDSDAWVVAETDPGEWMTPPVALLWHQTADRKE
jgi:hypothetical protein